MSVGFGFSVGDFIDAIQLVGTVIDALSASSKSSAELRELLRQLHTLETALREVENLAIDESLYAESLALKQSAAQCQLTISNFLTNTRSYQPYLTCDSGVTVRSKWKKVKWALCKKKDIVQFKSDLNAHTESIHLLLATLQMKCMDIGQWTQQSQQRLIASRIQDGFSKSMQKLSFMCSTLTRISAQAQELLESTRHIISMNCRVFQVVLDVQKLLTTIPGQIERQQPVYLNDALGRYAPFHLEFIRSSKAFTSVLSINFENLGSASQKILRNDFAIQDAHTKRDIDLERPWEECFGPGQHVEMSLVFDRSEHHLAACPNGRCGLIFRSLAIVDKPENEEIMAVSKAAYYDAPPHNRSSETRQTRPTLPKRKLDDEDDLTIYRRVRLRTMKSRFSRHTTGSNGFRTIVYELRDNDWIDRGTGYAKQV
ncbi:MAG: hypothetical protein Q9220_004801 [cf. Caloplaca sp. 1 TL-2023]